MDTDKLKAVALAARDERVWTLHKLAFQKAANPAAVLELIAEVELLRAEYAELREASIMLVDSNNRLRAAPAAGTVEKHAEPIAWARKWHVDGEKPEKRRNENGRLAWPQKFKFLPVTQHKIFPDDVPLVAAIEAHNARSPSCGP
jgi:hypothetical protein